jgi:hypothetical protein
VRATFPSAPAAEAAAASALVPAQPARPTWRIRSLLGGRHAMLSYNWDHQAEVKRARLLLEREGVKCWMDVDHMHTDIYDSMAEGVQGAAYVLPNQCQHEMCSMRGCLYMVCVCVCGGGGGVAFPECCCFPMGKNCNHSYQLLSCLSAQSTLTC